MTSKNNRASFQYYIKLCASIQIHRWIQTGVTVRKASIWVNIGDFCPVWLTSLMDDLEKYNREPLLYYFKLCLSFQGHRWFQTWVTVRKHSIRVKISDFLSHVTLKFDGWPWKTIGHPFYAASSYVHNFVAISIFKLELQSGKAQFGSNQWFFVPCDLEIWWMTLKNNRQPLLWCFKLCASFHNHQCIQARVTLDGLETPNLGQIQQFFSRVILKFDGWPWKSIGHLS